MIGLNLRGGFKHILFLGKNIMEHKQVHNFEYLPIHMGMCNLTVERFLQPFWSILSSWIITDSITNMKHIATILATMVYAMPSNVFMSIVFQLMIAKQKLVDTLFTTIQRISKQLSDIKNVPPLQFSKYFLFDKPLTEKQ